MSDIHKEAISRERRRKNIWLYEEAKAIYGFFPIFSLMNSGFIEVKDKKTKGEQRIW